MRPKPKGRPSLSGPASSDQRALASSLEPALHKVLHGKLKPIHWFKADWQRGGAATGKSVYEDESGTHQVVIKLPIGPQELIWTRRLQESSEELVVPRLFASGSELGGYDLAWLVMECLPTGPLALRWHENHVQRIAAAAAKFYASAAAFKVNQDPKREPWEQLISDAQKSVKVNHIADHKRWAAALKTLKRRSQPLVEQWRARRADQWLHGDLHMANAMTRGEFTKGSVVLIDLAEVHVGHWLEDAVYLERQFWAIPERMKQARPVRAIATARRRLGLEVETQFGQLAMVRRALLAGSAPAFMKSEGPPRYLAACLIRLESALASL